MNLAFIIDDGAWDVQPALTPPSINIDKNIIIKLLKTNQRLKAFNLGNIISDEHGIKGYKSTLPNTESIGPDTAIRSPKLILLLNLFNWFFLSFLFNIKLLRNSFFFDLCLQLSL